MENTNYEEKDLRAYNAWLQYIIHDELPQYAYCREPMKYHEASVRREHKDLLIKQKSEVIETMLFEYDEEEVLKFLKQEEYEIGLEEGEARGKAESIIELLGMKGNVSGELRERIYGESNPDILKQWLFAAATSDSIELFEESLVMVK